MQWIDDEKQFVSDEEEKEGICNLYQAALRDYYSADIWYQYLSFVKSSLPSEMPILLEEAINAFEYDCIDGPRLWSLLLEWSKSVNPPEQTEKLYARMLGNCYQASAECLESYKEWHQGISLAFDPSVVEIGEKSVKEFERRSILQMELTASIEVDHITTALRRFYDYTKFELQNDKKSGLSRTGFLYQRYAYTFRNLPDFWHSYFLYVYDFVKVGKKCNQVIAAHFELGSFVRRPRALLRTNKQACYSTKRINADGQPASAGQLLRISPILSRLPRFLSSACRSARRRRGIGASRVLRKLR